MSSIEPHVEEKMCSKGESQEFAKIASEVKGLGKYIHPAVPNPAPLGLFAFGLTTALLQMKHTRIGGDEEEDHEGTELVVLGFAMFFGGLLQVIAGLSEIKRNNVFGYTAFLLYGGFWMSMSTVYIIGFIATGEAPSVNPKTVQAMLFLVGTYTFILWICSFKLNITINILFFCLATTCFLLCGGVRNETVDKVGGWFGFITSSVAYWLASVELINDVLGEGKEIIPLGHWRFNRFKSHGAMHRPGFIHGTRASQIVTAPVSNNGASSVSKQASDVMEAVA